jgi:adenine-specific DNA-methyltransferase
MHAMCLAQSTTGHFAEFLPKDHPRLRSLRAIDVWEAFLRKCDDMQVVSSALPHEVLCQDYRTLLEPPSQADLFYLDPPYSDAQYSRFYHVLETLVLYDNPRLQHKGGYRAGRHQSRFSQRARAEGEFDWAVSRVAALGKPLVISYSSRGLVPRERLLATCRRHYRDVALTQAPHNHSSQGKGPAPVEELVLACR